MISKMKRAFEIKVVSFRHTKQTSKNEVDTFFKVNDNSTDLYIYV